jgi:hypothetical protein
VDQVVQWLSEVLGHPWRDPPTHPTGPRGGFRLRFGVKLGHVDQFAFHGVVCVAALGGREDQTVELHVVYNLT